MYLLNRLRSALSRFMYGRNGVDALGWATLLVQLLLDLASGLIRIGILAVAVRSLSLVCCAVLIYRLLSRDLPRRRAENARFLRWWSPKQNAVRAAHARHADKTHKYIKCSCGAYCRVPKHIGTVELTCPKCGKKKIAKT